MNILTSAQHTTEGAQQRERNSLVTGISAGLIPLEVLFIAIVLTLALTSMVLLLTTSLAFYVREQVMMVLAVSGLVVTVAAYGIGCIAAMRRIKRWQQTGMSNEARGALWTLAATALLVLLPLLLAVVA